MARSVITGAVDALLEASVVGSVTRIGYHAQRRLYGWAPLTSLPLEGNVAVVTGATHPGWADTKRERRARAKHRLKRTRRPDERAEAARLWQLCLDAAGQA